MKEELGVSKEKLKEKMKAASESRAGIAIGKGVRLLVRSVDSIADSSLAHALANGLSALGNKLDPFTSSGAKYRPPPPPPPVANETKEGTTTTEEKGEGDESVKTTKSGEVKRPTPTTTSEQGEEGSVDNPMDGVRSFEDANTSTNETTVETEVETNSKNTIDPDSLLGQMIRRAQYERVSGKLHMMC